MRSDISLSVDDLLKLHEERPYKRRKFSSPVNSRDDAGDSEGGSDSEDEKQTRPRTSSNASSNDSQIADSDSKGEDDDANDDRMLGAVTEVPSRIALPARNVNDDVQQKSVRTNATPSFSELGASKSLISSLATMSIKKPTPVQVACIPPLLQGMNTLTNYDDKHLTETLCRQGLRGERKDGLGKNNSFRSSNITKTLR